METTPWFQMFYLGVFWVCAMIALYFPRIPRWAHYGFLAATALQAGALLIGYESTTGRIYAVLMLTSAAVLKYQFWREREANR